MVILKILSLFLLSLFTQYSQAAGSDYQIHGRVTDAETSQPLAFAHVVAEGKRFGTLTDIDGFFRLEQPEGVKVLHISHVGYFSRIFELPEQATNLVIELQKRSLELEEVVFFAGENPAHRIIRNVMDNRRVNDPERISSFTFTSYNKFIATLDQDFYIERWELTRDSSFYNTKRFLDRQHIFMLESVTERMFRFPNLNSETVVANRVSGLQNPTFTMLATELQPFSFYANTITLLENEFISPLNRAAFGRYSYHLEDTLYQGADSVFVVSYRPRQGTNFDGLEGVLYINTNRWAIQNVTARPARQIIGGLSFNIRQKYQFLPDGVWFPVQLNTDIDFFSPEASDPAAIVPIRMLGRSYIQDIVINPLLRARDFSGFALDFSPQANKIGEDFWEQLRPESLSIQEKNTYHFMDSLGREINIEGVFNALEPLIFGEIPLGRFFIPLNSVYRFNSFEMHRIGAGLRTNRRFSQRIFMGGHYAWATGDRTDKYGFFGELVLWKRHDLRIGGSQRFDVSERGGVNFMEQNFLLGNNLIRSLYINKMDYTQRVSGYVSFLALRNFLSVELSASRGKTLWTDEYVFRPEPAGTDITAYRFTEASVRTRFAYGEALMNTPTRIIRLPSGYPVFFFNATRGFDNIDKGELNYLRLQSRLDIRYKIPLLGTQTWVLEAGYTNRADLPAPLLFVAKAGNRDYYLASPLSFGTMAMNEFVSDQFVSLFFQHNFGSLLFRLPRYAPELMLITNMGVGKFTHPEKHLFLQGQSWEQGYFESGFAINRILPQHWVRRVVLGMSPGVEVLYRYGPYSFPEKWDNLTIKLSIITSF